MDKLFYRVMAIRRPVVFRRSLLLYGWVFPEVPGDPIYISLNRHGDEDPAITYLHECLHVLYPDMFERDIQILTRKAWDALSSRQRFVLSRKLFSREWRTD